MAYQACTNEFTGPLDILFGLVERGELAIESICLAEVVRQYIDYLETTAHEEPAAISAALVSLARLVALKARRLAAPELPPVQPDQEEEADPGLLALRLEEYDRYCLARDLLLERAEAGLRSYIRLAPMPEAEQRLAHNSVSIALLVRALQGALATAPQVTTPHQGPSLAERMSTLRNAIARGRVSLRVVFNQCSTRLEMIVTFLALLELMRVGEARVYQLSLFGDITVEPSSGQQEGESARHIDTHIVGAGKPAGC